jgi:hypothetical protein
MKRIQTLSALFSFPGFRPQPAARELWRSPCPVGHIGPAKKTAVCSGCGMRLRTFYDRTTRRVRDIAAAG